MGKLKSKEGAIIWILMIPILLMAGCAAANFRASPQLQERAQSIKVIAIMPPSVKVYQLSAGGVKELMDEWTATAKQNVGKAVEAELSRSSGIAFKPFPNRSAILEANPELKAEDLGAELEDNQALFDAVSASVILHTYIPEHTFPEKLKGFDYSLGPEVATLAKMARADALLFVSGFDHISTGGRKTLMFLGFLVGAATGIYAGPGGGPAALSAAFVEQTTGAILWYNLPHPSAGYDLRNPESTAELVEQMFEGFPGKAETKESTRQPAKEF